MKSNEQIAILMATYNGAAFVGEQIDSILAQTAHAWHLFVHDDGSDDGTMAVLQRYADREPQRITLLSYASQGGACRNFLSMLETVEAGYYMFCDQDDVWLPEKIEVTWQRMKDLELQHGDATPIIVHSDLSIVDAQLNELSPSFISNQRIRLDAIRQYADYAATNTVTGCTMMMNLAAKRCMARPAAKALMHDAWICLSVAANNGIVSFIDRPLVRYRQHGSNTLGALDMSKLTLGHKLSHALEHLRHDVAHFRQMNAVRPLSPVAFVKAKLKYRKNRNQS